MKRIIYLMSIVLIPILTWGQVQYRSIELKRVSLDSRVKTVTNETADHALRIASFLLNSKEFQDSLLKRTFNYHNLCVGCDINKVENQPKITGKRVLDSLFRKHEALLTLLVKKRGKLPLFGNCFGLGKTCPNTNFITSFYKNINCDMGKDLPFEYAYAIHICHEYAHNVGYCHTYSEDDVAESVGWIAFYFVTIWYNNRIRIAQE